MKKYLIVCLLTFFYSCSSEESCEQYPTLTTEEANNITDKSVTLVGKIIPPTCDENVTSQGFVYSKTELPKVDDNLIEKSGTNISTELENLEQNTTYYVRTFFENTEGIFYGNEIEFKTIVGNAVLSLRNIRNITVNSVDVSLAVNSTGGGTILKKGVCYSITENPTVNDNKLDLSSGNSGGSGTIENLTNYTVYYLKGYVENENGIHYSEQENITTLDYDNDSDGIYNYQDNCIDVANSNQEDFDNDGIGDVCDDDIDGDGIENSMDNCPTVSNIYQEDFDNDEIGDYCDDDSLIYVPDDNFEKFLEGNNYNADDYVILSVTSSITSIGNSSGVNTHVDFSSNGTQVFDFTGIESLVNLEEFDVRIEGVSSLDLSNNLKLKIVDIYSFGFDPGPDLNSIVFPSNNSIETLIIYSSINDYQFDKFNNLLELRIGGNARIENLDVSNLTSLTSLQANFFEMDYNNRFKGGILNTPDFSNNINLKTLIIQYAQFSTPPDLSNNTNLETINFKGITKFETLDLSNLYNLKSVIINDTETLKCVKVNQETLDRINNNDPKQYWFNYNNDGSSWSISCGYNCWPETIISTSECN